jgi:uncharacterized membrane protein YphA (DoxX/SURF4 family)
MFPDGLPGVALFLLRVVVIGMLVDSTFQSLMIENAATWKIVALALISLLLLCGVFTPIASAFSILFEAICWPAWDEQKSLEFSVSALVMIVLSLLGPGAYSIDSKMFGRRIILHPEYGNALCAERLGQPT